MSLTPTSVEDAPPDSPKGQRCLLGHHYARGFVRHAGAVYQACLLVLMESRTGNVPHWIVMPYQRGRSIDIRPLIFETLIMPVLRSPRALPTALCTQSDPDYPPSLAPFFAELAKEGGPNIPLDITNPLDDAKLDILCAGVESYLDDTLWNAITMLEESDLPTLDELQTIISTYIGDWNKQSDRWEN